MPELKVRIITEAQTAGLRQMQAALEQFRGSLGGLQGMLASLRGTLTAAFGGLALTALTRAAVAGAQQSAVAQAQLRQALLSTGQASEQAAAALVRQAQALERLTGQDDATVHAVQRILLSLGATIEQTQRLTPLVLDLAAAMGTDATTAARLLGQALDGQATGLARYNITARNFDTLTDQLTRAFGGQARALQAARGPLGELAILQDQALKGLGQALLQTAAPALRSLNGALEALARTIAAPGFAEGLRATWHLLGSAALTAGILALGTALGRVYPQLAAFLSLWRQFGAASLAAAFTEAQLAAAGLAARLAALVAAVDTLRNAWGAWQAEMAARGARAAAGDTLTESRRVLEREIAAAEAAQRLSTARAAEMRARLDTAFAGRQETVQRSVSAGTGGATLLPPQTTRVRDLAAEHEALTAISRELRQIHTTQDEIERRQLGEWLTGQMTRGVGALEEAFRRAGERVLALAEWRRALIEQVRGFSEIAERMDQAEAEREATRQRALAEYYRGVSQILEIEERREETARRRAEAEATLQSFHGQLGLQLQQEFGVVVDAQGRIQNLVAAARDAASTIAQTIGNAFRVIGDQITKLILGTVTWGQALANIGRTILAQLVASIVNFFVTLAVRAMLTALLGTAITEAAAASAASAWAGPAILASTATYGTAPAVGTAALGAALAAAPAIAAAASFAGGFARGGLVTGPGGPAEDRVLARLSPGEFVIPATAVRRAGLPALEAIRQGLPPWPLRAPAREESQESAPLRVVIVDQRREAEELLRDPRWRSALVNL
jgi:hypothetical protein